MTTITIIDNSNIFCESLGVALSRADWSFEIVEKYNSVSDFLQKPDAKSDVVIIDPSIAIEGLFTITSVCDHVCSPVICLCSNPNEEDVDRAIRMGIKAYISKSIDITELKTVINNVVAGKTYFDQSHLAPLLEKYRKMFIENEKSLFTQREISVIKKVAEGKSNREIAEESNLAEKTVKNYVSRIIEKLAPHVKGRVGIALYARECNFINLERAA